MQSFAMLIELSTDDAEAITRALEAALAGSDQPDVIAHLEMIRDDVASLHPHPGILLDLSDLDNPQLLAGERVPVSIAIIRSPTDPIEHYACMPVRRDLVDRAMMAVDVQDAFAAALTLVRQAIDELGHAAVGVNANRQTAERVVSGLLRDITAWSVEYAKTTGAAPYCAPTREHAA